MFFPESEAIAHDHPDLQSVAERVDQRLADICSSAPLRPGDFSCVLGYDENQIAAVFDILAQAGVLYVDEMMECERCQNLMSADAFRQASENEDTLECTSCDRVIPHWASSILVYRMTPNSLNHTKANVKPRADQLSELLGTQPSGDEPLSERARCVLTAMLKLKAVDSDRRKSAEVIAPTALGPGTDANALKTVMAELRARKLVFSKTGRGGGYWFTDVGKRRAEKLGDRHRNSATV